MGDAIIQIDPESRSLVVITDEDTHAEIEKVVKNLDLPKPQVLIKVLFLEVTYNKGLDLGIEGAYNFKVGNGILSTTGTGTTTTTTTGSNSLGGTTTSVLTATAPITSSASAGTAAVQSIFGLASQTGSGSFLRLSTDDWSATLRALATKGHLNVLSRPSILARNNQEAVITVGQEVPFVTNSQTTALGQTINTIQYQDVGIILRVTPFITTNNNIEMIVAPEISALSNQTVPVSAGVNAPVINKRSAETVVVTPHATTVVIGGLMETQRTSSVDKIPLLGDIPLLGMAFRHTITADVKRELLIFLTPYIVNTTEGLKDLTLDELNRTEMTSNAFTAEEIAKHMDTLKLETAPKAVKATTTTTKVERSTVILKKPAAK
ncbi:MAG: ral secretion pathway protein [Chthoniobacter sp.]|nr:ral secretion pathway protein [Chthoniobacter sp.]